MCGFFISPSSFDQIKANFLFEKYIAYRGVLPKKELVFNHYNFKFSRLPIVDVGSYQNQPYQYKNHVLVFNGELYNYQNIRQLLEKKYKVQFTSKTDVEVFLKGFLTLGPKKFFKIACGMWAYVISDKLGNFFWGRDEYGIKPLFFMKKNYELFFSSSQPALLETFDNHKLNKNILRRFIVTGFQDPNSFSFYDNCELVKPGNCYYFNYDKKEIQKEICLFSDEKILDKSLREVVDEAIISQYPKEVNSSIALSGGLDSSIILHVLSRNNLKFTSFSLDLLNSKKEKSLIFQTIKQYKKQHQFIKTESSELLNSCKEIIFNFGQPLRSCQPLNQYSLRKVALQYNSKVFFTGDGSDEIFGGYTQGFFFFLKQLIDKGTKENLIRNKLFDFKDLINLKDEFLKEDIKKLIERKTNIFNQDLTWQNIFKKEEFTLPKTPEDLKSYCDFRLFIHPMPYWLMTEDILSLVNGIETRIPFLDQRIVYKSKFLERENFYFNGKNKYHLRNSFSDLPDHIKNCKNKFPRPSDTTEFIFENEISDSIEKFLKSDDFKELFQINHDFFLEVFKSDKDRKCSLRSDNWFRILSSYLFLNK
ncbi:asparagine synthase-related protein [Prochlorococcus sp. MIT 0604]|uniref:asparagine synthase-related protein n=1 Tax=Prochlorococcus sp. MIT 0604 TaxID=1501268 RepID=UPI0004F6862C|nr:asparagine synthase-related protein [Prochlorococcus sp. MIT 0604]AIQ95482.1 Asparagine synthetase (glutamine-hydrolyzing) [Prochlorococcus sp. MIT 0604]